MKKIAISLIAVGVLTGAALAQGGQKAPATKTLEGEVLDLSCYLGMGASGAKHAACALKCVQAGEPAGLLTADNSVYLLVGSHEHGKAYKTVRDLAGKKASVTGSVVSQGGLNALIVEKAEKAK